MSTKPLTLSDVLAAWMVAKESERTAIEHRRSLDKLVQQYLPKKDEGTVSQDDGDYKVSITYGVTRKVDTEKLSADWAILPGYVQTAFRWKADVNTANLREMNDDGTHYASKYITTSPSSPTVKVELRHKEAA